MEQNLYSLFHVVYEINGVKDQLALVAASSEKRIPVILGEDIRKDPDIYKGKDVSLKITGAVDTGFRTNEERVKRYSLEELFIAVKK